jgi:hypothetical protein
VPEQLLGTYNDENDKASAFALAACTMRYLFTVRGTYLGLHIHIPYITYYANNTEAI